MANEADKCVTTASGDADRADKLCCSGRWCSRCAVCIRWRSRWLAVASAPRRTRNPPTQCRLGDTRRRGIHRQPCAAFRRWATPSWLNERTSDTLRRRGSTALLHRHNTAVSTFSQSPTKSSLHAAAVCCFSTRRLLCSIEELKTLSVQSWFSFGRKNSRRKHVLLFQFLFNFILLFLQFLLFFLSYSQISQVQITALHTTHSQEAIYIPAWTRLAFPQSLMQTENVSNVD